MVSIVYLPIAIRVEIVAFVRRCNVRSVVCIVSSVYLPIAITVDVVAFDLTRCCCTIRCISCINFPVTITVDGVSEVNQLFDLDEQCIDVVIKIVCVQS